jgi:hypothetical protein
MFFAAGASYAFADTKSVIEGKILLWREKYHPTDFHPIGRLEDRLPFLDLDLYFT